MLQYDTMSYINVCQKADS